MGSDRPMQGKIRELFLAKQKRRRELAGLPIERKIGILISMQKMAGRLRKGSEGMKHHSWDV